MKNLFLSLSVFIFSFCFSQSYSLYSDVWSFDKNTKNFSPKDGSNFSYPSSDLLSKIDTSKISDLLLESLNNFRKDYNKPPVTENSEMSKMATLYAKNLSNNFCHDVNLPKNQAEVIATINYILISKIDHNTSDVNKIIADCVFDIFVGSDNHTAMLLNDDYQIYGFGIYQNKFSFSICVRSTR
jgi:uncharacterized protein YkwD